MVVGRGQSWAEPGTKPQTPSSQLLFTHLVPFLLWSYMVSHCKGGSEQAIVQN